MKFRAQYNRRGIDHAITVNLDQLLELLEQNKDINTSVRRLNDQ